MSSLTGLLAWPFDLLVLRYGPIDSPAQVSANELDWQLALLKEHCRPVALSEVSAFIRGRCGLPRRGAVVSFDAADERTVMTVARQAHDRDVATTVFVATDEVDISPSWGWPALRALKGGRMEFGSRTASGRPLSGRSPQEWRSELTGSRQRMEQLLEAPCLAVAYPGSADADDAGLLAEAGLAGYRLGLSQAARVNRVGALFPLALGRVTVQPGLSRAAFVSILKRGRGEC